MDSAEIFLIIGLAILLVVMFMYYSKCKVKFGKMLFGMLSGVAVIYPAQMIITALGASFCVNIFTISVSAILGIPGVLLLSITSFL